MRLVAGSTAGPARTRTAANTSRPKTPELPSGPPRNAGCGNGLRIPSDGSLRARGAEEDRGSASRNRPCPSLRQNSRLPERVRATTSTSPSRSASAASTEARHVRVSNCARAWPERLTRSPVADEMRRSTAPSPSKSPARCTATGVEAARSGEASLMGADHATRRATMIAWSPTMSLSAHRYCRQPGAAAGRPPWQVPSYLVGGRSALPTDAGRGLVLNQTLR